VPTKQEPFSTAIVELESCLLRSTLSEAEATQISQFLALMDPWSTLGFTADSLKSYLRRDDPALRRFGMFDGGVPIGVLCVRYPWLRGPYIELLGVEASHQGKGITKEIMAWIEQQTTPYAKNIWVAASAFNIRALNVYERLGFTQIGVLDGLVTDDKSEIFFRKRLR